MIFNSKIKKVEPVIIQGCWRILQKLCGFGVALSTETAIGELCADRACLSEHKHVRKSCSKWVSNPGPQDSEADVLPLEPQWLIIPLHVWLVCGLCAKCDHAVYSQ